jgi:hypothetical protein
VATDVLLAHSRAYLRLNPSLGISDTGLVDCFHANVVETSVKKWLANEGKIYISEVAANLVELNTAPITSTAEARFIEPPKPPPNTNLGYNPQLDERRPETMIDYLK